MLAFYYVSSHSKNLKLPSIEKFNAILGKKFAMVGGYVRIFETILANQTE